MKQLRTILRWLKSWLLGSAGCLSLLGALVTTGWTYRLCRRRIIGHWQKKSGIAEEQTAPRWLIAESSMQGTPWRFVESLKRNFLTGLGHGFTAFLVTLLPGLLLAFAWWGGWNNSFNKGYEQAGVGPALGMLGIALMGVALIYLPLAQVHQAMGGRVGAFFEFRTICRLIARAPWGGMLLAGLTAVFGLPFVASSFYLSTAVATRPELLEMPPAAIVGFLNSYYFLWAVLFVFPAFLIIRLLAAAVYARAARSLAKEGRYSHEHLTVEIHPPDIRHRTIKWLFRTAKLTALGATYAALVAFSFLPLISQFSNAIPVKRWLLHPMVQVPLHRHIPKPLQQASSSRHANEPGGFMLWMDEQE